MATTTTNHYCHYHYYHYYHYHYHHHHYHHQCHYYHCPYQCERHLSRRIEVEIVPVP